MNTEVILDPDDPQYRSTNTPGEKTGPQTPGFYGLSGHAGYGGTLLSGHNPVERMLRASGSVDGRNPYDPPPHVPYAVPVGVSNAPMPVALAVVPLTLRLYRAMALDPTLSIAEASIILTIMAAETIVVVDDELKDDPVADRGRAILDMEIVRQRQELLSGCLQSLRYGWKDFEVVYARKNDIVLGSYIGIEKFKELTGENMRPQLDPRTGALAKVACAGVMLELPYLLHIVEGQEDDNYFGVSRQERARRAHFNELNTEDMMQQLMSKATGKAARVGVPPESVESLKAKKTPNMDMAITVAKALGDGQAVAYYQTAELNPLKMQSQPDLAKSKLVDIDFIDIGNPGPAIAAMDQRITNCQKLKLRAWWRPERSITEATTAGSRADSESHGDVAVSDAETTHERIWRQVDRQTGARLIEENCGPEYVNRVRIQAVPLQDARKATLAAFFDKLMDDAAFKSGLIEAMGTNGVEGLIGKMDLGVQLEHGKFEYKPQQPGVGQSPTPAPGQAVDPATNPPADQREHKRGEEDDDDDDDDDDHEDLSAAMVPDELADLFPQTSTQADSSYKAILTDAGIDPADAGLAGK